MLTLLLVSLPGCDGRSQGTVPSSPSRSPLPLRYGGADSGPGMRLFPRSASSSRESSRRGREEPERPRERPAAVGWMGTAGGSPCTGGGSGDSATPRAGLTHRTMTSVYPRGLL